MLHLQWVHLGKSLTMRMFLESSISRCAGTGVIHSQKAEDVRAERTCGRLPKMECGQNRSAGYGSEGVKSFSANGKLCKFVRGSGKGKKKTGSSGLDAVLEENMCNQLSVKCL